MSQSYYFDCPEQQYYPCASHGPTDTLQFSIQHDRPPTLDYNHQNDNYDAGQSGLSSNTQPVDNVSTFAQTYSYSYSDVNYAPDTTTNAYSSHTSYDPIPNHTTTSHPDLESQILYRGVPQYGDATQSQSWTGLAHYTEAPTSRPDDLQDPRWGSYVSTTTNSTELTANSPSSPHSHDPILDDSATYHLDSVSQIPYQDVPHYGYATSGQSWSAPAQYAEVSTAQTDDLHDQRRGSFTSMTTDGSRSVPDSGSSEPIDYGYAQRIVVRDNNHADRGQQTNQQQSVNFGMYSPTQHMAVQELARETSCEDTAQQTPIITVRHSSFEAPQGTPPVHESDAEYERCLSDVSKELNNSFNSQPGPAEVLPLAHPHPLYTESHSQPETPPSNLPNGNQKKDMSIQKRQVASYQDKLRLKQERRYRVLNHLRDFATTYRNQACPTIDKQYSHALAQLLPYEYSPYQQNDPARHRSQSSSLSSPQLPSAPVVPSQVDKKFAHRAKSSPKVEGGKKTSPTKPALACIRKHPTCYKGLHRSL